MFHRKENDKCNPNVVKKIKILLSNSNKNVNLYAATYVFYGHPLIDDTCKTYSPFRRSLYTFFKIQILDAKQIIKKIH